MTFQDIARWFGARCHVATADRLPVEEVSREEIIRIIDELAQKRRGLSAQQLLSAYRAGTLERSGDVSDLIAYADLLSPTDPVFDRATESEVHYAVR